jgi:hypothetical protein
MHLQIGSSEERNEEEPLILASNQQRELGCQARVQVL